MPTKLETNSFSNTITLGEFRRATKGLPDDAVLIVRSPGSYFSRGVSSVHSSVTAFTAPVPETVFVDIDIDPESFKACQEIKGEDEQATIDDLQRQEVAERVREWALGVSNDEDCNFNTEGTN